MILFRSSSKLGYVGSKTTSPDQIKRGHNQTSNCWKFSNNFWPTCIIWAWPWHLTYFLIETYVQRRNRTIWSSRSHISTKIVVDTNKKCLCAQTYVFGRNKNTYLSGYPSYLELTAALSLDYIDAGRTGSTFLHVLWVGSSVTGISQFWSAHTIKISNFKTLSHRWRQCSPQC